MRVVGGKTNKMSQCRAIVLFFLHLISVPTTRDVWTFTLTCIYSYFYLSIPWLQNLNLATCAYDDCVRHVNSYMSHTRCQKANNQRVQTLPCNTIILSDLIKLVWRYKCKLREHGLEASRMDLRRTTLSACWLQSRCGLRSHPWRRWLVPYFAVSTWDGKKFK